MQLNVRNLDDATATRLAEQAETEGVSVSEWVRQVLNRAASLASPAELSARRDVNVQTAMSVEEFDHYYAKRLRRRSA
jgi:plasmid stability protein